METTDTIADLVQIVATAKGCSFASLTYRAKGTGELAKFRLRMGGNLQTAYEKDIEFLAGLIPTLDGMPKMAAQAVHDSLVESLAQWAKGEYHPQYTNAETYIVNPEGLPGISIRKFTTEHGEAGEVSILAMEDGKTVIEAGEYKTRNSSPMTIEKGRIKALLRTGKIRRFTLRKVHRAALYGDTLELSGE